jgi:cytidine deaminase
MKTTVSARNQALLGAAREAREFAYAPYSNFKVGAALRAKNGDVYTGCNVENASYALSICAERVAVFNAIAHGNLKFTELAIVVDARRLATPCGACRQVLAEFADDLVIVLGNLKGTVKRYRLAQLFPSPFRL